VPDNRHPGLELLMNTPDLPRRRWISAAVSTGDQVSTLDEFDADPEVLRILCALEAQHTRDKERER